MPNCSICRQVSINNKKQIKRYEEKAMNNFANETIEIITAIQGYIDKHGNADIIEKYYQEHGSYKGIVEYLEEVEKQTPTNQQ